MQLTFASIFLAALGVGAHAIPNHNHPQAREIVRIPDYIENVASRHNGELLLNIVSGAKVYSLNPASKLPKPKVVANIEQVMGLFGIAQVGHDVFAVAGANFTVEQVIVPNTMRLSLLDFRSGKSEPIVRNIVTESNYGPVNGLATLPHSRHIILGADSTRGEILRIDTNTGHVEVAIKNEQLAPISDGPFNIGVNGIKVFRNYLYFTNSARQTLNRVQIDHKGNQVGKFEVIYSFNKGSNIGPDDFAVDRHGNAYIACRPDTLVRVTPGGKATVLSEGFLIAPTAVSFGKDEKSLYVVTAGQGNGESDAQVVEFQL